MRIPVVLSCLIVCFVFSFPLFAQNTSQSDSALPEYVDLDAALAGSVDLSGVDNTSDAPDSVPAGSQGSQNGNGSGPGSGGANKSGPGALPATTYVFPSNSQMNRYWLRNILGPKAFVGAAFSGTWNTWVTDSPSEWHQNASGWSKRFGASLLDNGINTSSLILLSRAVHHDPIYYRCECTGLKPRAWHAIRMVYRSHNRDGNLVFSPVRLIAPFTGPMVTRNTIYPSRYGFSNAASAGAYYLAGSVAWNLAREFIWNWR